MAKVIILYHTSARTIAGRLHDFLSSRIGDANVTLGADKLIRPGDDFLDAIQDGVRAADALLMLMGNNWIDESQLRDEHAYTSIAIRTALEEKRRLIPVLIDDITLPPAEALPEAFSALARRTPMRLKEDNFRTDAMQLAETIGATQPQPAATPSPAQPAAPPPTPRESAPTPSDRDALIRRISEVERAINDLETDIRLTEEKLKQVRNNKIVAVVVGVVGLFLVVAVLGVVLILGAIIWWSNLNTEEKNLSERRTQLLGELNRARQAMTELRLKAQL